MSLLRPQLSLARQFTRTLVKSKKVPVQLLEDFPPHGVKGEIIDVAPALMRNVLHVNNRACYITKTQGPRIPVVVPEKVVVPKVKKVKKVELEEEVETTPTLSIDELSKLFSQMKTGPNQNSEPSFKFTASAAETDVAEVTVEETAKEPSAPKEA